MQSSESTQELEAAIRELDGMYQDLEESCRRHSEAEIQIENVTIPTKYSNFDDDNDDYDIPRPAEGIINAQLRLEQQDNYTSLSDEEREDEREHKFIPEYYRTVPLRSPKSPSTTSFRSEYSSGLGTLPKYRIPVEAEFPSPPDFTPTPPPVPPSPSDSDYDEVPSRSDSEDSDPDTFVYTHPVQSNTPHSSPDYAVVHKEERLSHDVIRVNNAEIRDAESPDNARYSVHSQRASFAIQEVVKDPNTHTRIPMVVQVKKVETVNVNEEVRSEHEEHSFVTPTVQIVQNEAISQNDDDVIATQLPMDENRNVGMKSSIRASTTSRSTSSRRSAATSHSSRSRPSSRQRSSMDVESQKGKKDEKGPACPCECRAAVPLMSVAVIICLAAFLFLVIGYVYVGIQNDEYLANLGGAASTTTPSGITGSGNGE